MTFIGKMADGLEAAARNFTVEVLAKDLQPEVLAALMRHNKDSHARANSARC